MNDLDRDNLAALWQGILGFTGRPQEIFGEFSDRLCACADGHVDQLPHPGFVGRNYRRGGLLFLAMNPGNGTGGPDPAQEPHYEGLKRLQKALPQDRRKAFDALMAYDESWHPQIRIMNVVVKPVMDGVGCSYDSIAYMNVLKWRTKDSKRLAPLYKLSMKAHTLGQLEALDPGVIVLLGVGVSNVLHRIPEFRQSYAEHCITIPRTVGDHYLAPAGQVAVQLACARFNSLIDIPPARPLREPKPIQPTEGVKLVPLAPMLNARISKDPPSSLKGFSMDQDHIVEIVNHSGVPYRLGTRQKQLNQVRFFGIETKHSLNLGYAGGEFVADFVFKADDRNLNLTRCKTFIEKFSGERRKDKTIFARITLPYFKEAQLIEIIQEYWAMAL